MARRKNTRRIDPRYFLNETTYRELNEEALTPHLLGKGNTSRPLKSLQNYMLGDIDLADMIRGMFDEMQDVAMDMSGASQEDITRAYLQKNPDRKIAFDTLLQVVQAYDKAMAAQASGQDTSEFEKRLAPMIPKLKKLGIGTARKSDTTARKGFDQKRNQDRRSARPATGGDMYETTDK